MKSNLEQWFLQNANPIETGLAKHASELSTFNDGNFRLPLSDLELCAAVSRRIIPLPPDFRSSQVEVRIGGRRWYTSHFVGTRGREVVDYVFGQFFADARRQISGIAYAVEQAPQLFYVLSEEVSVLHATMSEIKDVFNVEYVIT